MSQFDIAELYALARERGYDLEGCLTERNFGGQVQLSAQDPDGQPKRIADVSVESPWQARAWQVTWSITNHRNVDVGAGVPLFQTFATPQGNSTIRVHFGTGVVQETIECDLFPGGSLTVSAQQVQVDLVPQDYPTQVGSIVAAHVSPAPGKERGVVHLTRDLGVVAFGADVSLPVPRFARAFTLVREDPQNFATWTVDAREARPPNVVTNIAEYAFAQQAGQQSYGVFYPTPARANELLVTSGEAADNLHAAVIFRLEV